MVVSKIVSFFLLLALPAFIGCHQHPSNPQEKETRTDEKPYKKYATFEIPREYLEDSPVAILNHIGNNCDTSVDLFLDHDADLQLYATGEGLYNMQSSIIPPWFCDNVEVFFDMLHNRAPFFDRNGDDRQYFFTWHKNKIEGQNVALNGVVCRQADPAPNIYTMEISMPWQSLGYVRPASGVSIGFDIMIDDNDSTDLQGQITWHGKTAFLSSRTNSYGAIVLDSTVGIATPTSDSAFSKRVLSAPVIDGIEDPCWKKAKKYVIQNTVGGEVTGPDDLSGVFSTLWDQENLYLFIKVKDDKKRQASALFDYGSITDSKGSTVWAMDVTQSKYAGGALKNRYVDTVLHLKAGKYTVRYHTDNSHAWHNWDDKPPGMSLYGIALYHKDQ
jgi:hypothetical protein